ncbi:uncharacterized protein LOC125320272 [Corvus hawaiiensis]|uniref:uncharacterized protein LOC125320272 n=1 Tax=Corvus hawaiiensis TaxID=134902 RepID=UPI002019A426|nr:uncharacterized protein LOC125320272 [Corvus hawaiiensis]
MPIIPWFCSMFSATPLSPGRLRRLHGAAQTQEGRRHAKESAAHRKEPTLNRLSANFRNQTSASHIQHNNNLLACLFSALCYSIWESAISSVEEQENKLPLNKRSRLEKDRAICLKKIQQLPPCHSPWDEAGRREAVATSTGASPLQLTGLQSQPRFPRQTHAVRSTPRKRLPRTSQAVRHEERGGRTAKPSQKAEPKGGEGLKERQGECLAQGEEMDCLARLPARRAAPEGSGLPQPVCLRSPAKEKRLGRATDLRGKEA